MVLKMAKKKFDNITGLTGSIDNGVDTMGTCTVVLTQATKSQIMESQSSPTCTAAVLMYKGNIGCGSHNKRSGPPSPRA